MEQMPPSGPPGTSPGTSDSGCWPNDPGYLGRRVWVNYAPDLKLGCFFDAQLLDHAGQPLLSEIDVSKPIGVRFRVEAQPREDWADARGDWTFDLLFAPPPTSAASELRLSALFLQGGMPSASFQGDKTPCVDVNFAMAPYVLPGLGDSYVATATVAFKPTSGPISSMSAQVLLGSYLVKGIPSPAPDQVKKGGRAPSAPLSKTMQSIAKELATGEITSFDIARAI